LRLPALRPREEAESVCLASTLKNLARPTALKREMADVLMKAFKHDDCDLLLGTCAHSRQWCCLSDA
jgi:hypothetical protein